MKNLVKEAALLKKYLTGEATPEEEEQARRLLENSSVRKRLLEMEREESLGKVFDGLPYSGEEGFERFRQRVETRKGRSRTRVMRLLGVAAGVAAVVALALGVWTMWPGGSARNVADVAPLDPGQTKGRLILADGREVKIEKEQTVSLSADGAAVNYKDGCLVYDSSDPAAERLDCRKVESRNQFVIPSGGENTIVLSDGTRVKLNAESKLIYPTRFLNRQRTVFLEGEAFFDVTPDKTRPFVVQTRLGDVKVLGTRFNVNVYPEDSACCATLVEGRVAVNTPALARDMILEPGEQAVFSGTQATKSEVELEEYVGWVKGLYTFKNKKLKDIMRTFERWYNIDVVYLDDTLADLPYTGSVKRYENIGPFLEALQMTSDLRCYVEGRTVYFEMASR